MTTPRSFRRGDVVLLTFPFTSGAGTKNRPALVLLDTGDADVVLARITTRHHATAADVVLRHWREAGLLAPSVARLHQVITVEKALITQTHGSLHADDSADVETALRRLFA
jgi:mRNA interferase MazF